MWRSSLVTRAAYSVADVVGDKCFPVYGWKSTSAMFGVQVRDKPSFLRLLESHGLELELGGKGIESVD